MITIEGRMARHAEKRTDMYGGAVVLLLINAGEFTAPFQITRRFGTAPADHAAAVAWAHSVPRDAMVRVEAQGLRTVDDHDVVRYVLTGMCPGSLRIDGVVVA